MFAPQQYTSYDYSPETALKLLLELQKSGVEEAFLTLLNSRTAEVSYSLPSDTPTPNLTRLHTIITTSRIYVIHHDYSNFMSVITNTNSNKQYLICSSPLLPKTTCTCPDFQKNYNQKKPFENLNFECKHLIGRRLGLFREIVSRAMPSSSPKTQLKNYDELLSQYDDLF